MSLQATPSGERVRIGFFGVRNAGKSSLVNAITGQDLAVVSDTPGTTTDPVSKAMELLPAGPVTIVDTPGIDDAGDLGAQRVRRAERSLRSCDVAVLVADATTGLPDAVRALLSELEAREVPVVVAWSKADLLGPDRQDGPSRLAGSRDAVPVSAQQVLVSAKTGEGVDGLKELLGRLASGVGPRKRIVADLLDAGDVVVLVAPIDASAPKGRIILPQQMVLRDVLDAHAVALTCQPEELPGVLAGLAESPRIVITDSQVFAAVAGIVSQSVPLTSFSILMARYKGDLDELAAGAAMISQLTAESEVLVSEGCTHHRQCEDIGAVKIPRWIEKFAGARPQFSFTSGGEFPDDLERFDLVIHCGGCMLAEKEMAHRMAMAHAASVPVVNYGVAIAHMNGMLERALAALSPRRHL